MARRITGAALGLALAVAGLGAGAAPAAADPVNPWPSAAACASGAITGHRVLPEDRLGPYLELSGWIQPCADEKGDGPAPGARFGFAYFGLIRGLHPMGVVHVGRLRAYGSTSVTEITPFAGRYDLWGSGSFRERAPICLMRDAATKLACVVVDLVEVTDPKSGETTPSFVVTPIPLTDPRVDPHGTEFANGNATNPECAACV